VRITTSLLAVYDCPFRECTNCKAVGHSARPRYRDSRSHAALALESGSLLVGILAS
jgi:hypothetical protein